MTRGTTPPVDCPESLKLARERFLPVLPGAKVAAIDAPGAGVSHHHPGGQLILDGNPPELNLTGFVPTPQVRDQGDT